MARVLGPGGVVSFTVWCPPEQGGEFVGLIFKIYELHANMELDLPPAPETKPANGRIARAPGGR